MLVLKRNLMQSIEIGESIRVTVVEIKGDTVKLGVDAPKDIKVWREELRQRIDGLPERLG